MTFEVDVLVAGAGGAGLAAALAAGQQGAAVVAIEANTTFRVASNTAMSTSMIPAGGTRLQEAAGILDSPAEFLADIERKTGNQADAVVAGALTELAPALVHWLIDDCGVRLSLVTDMNYPGHSVYRCHAVADRAGRSLHTALLAAVRENPSIDLIVPMRLGQLQERPGGFSATVETPDGQRETLEARTVVLATNGFGANPELVRKHVPEIAEARYHGGDGSRGDALAVGAALHADIGFLDAYQGHGSLAVPQGILLTWATVMHGGVLVDGSGQRFGDETVGYSEFGARVLARPGGVAWMVFDARVHEACLAFRDYQDAVEAGAIVWHQDPETLAHAIGCPRAALDLTLAATALAAETGGPDELGRRYHTPPLTPPYAAVRVTGALFHTQGGLRVDANARVQRGGEPIPGVYAAGGAAIGISGHGAGGYLAGNGLLSALGLGFLAGRHAASAAGQLAHATEAG